MLVPTKAILGSILVAMTYVLWFSYVYVLDNKLFFFHPWLDIPLHISGGFTLTLLFSVIFMMRGSIHVEDTLNYTKAFWIVWAAMMVGVLWEYYEYWFKLQDTPGNLLIDTLSDLGNDLIGAILAMILVTWVIKKNRKKVPTSSSTMK